MSFLVRTAAPSAPVVSVADAKTHLRVDTSDDDTYLGALCTAASYAVEELVGRPLVTQTWAYSLRFIGGGNDKLYLPKTPVQSLSSVAYYDTSEAAQTVSTSAFDLFKDDDRAVMRPKTGNSWPSIYDRPDGLTITFVCGYGAASAVPEPVAHAVKMLIAHMYEARSETVEVPAQVTSLCNLYRRGWVAG